MKSCDQLMIAGAGLSGKALKNYLRTHRDELAARVDICVKLTVHRVRKQPGFDDPKVIGMMCNMNDRVFNQLCMKAGLRK